MYTESVSLTFETDPAIDVIQLVDHIKRKKKHIKIDISFYFVTRCTSIFEVYILLHECNLC